MENNFIYCFRLIQIASASTFICSLVQVIDHKFNSIHILSFHFDSQLFYYFQLKWISSHLLIIDSCFYDFFLGNKSKMVTMFKPFFEVFFPKAAEYVANLGINGVLNVKYFQRNLETLQKSLMLLSAKASDVKEEIKNAELSGRKKRKREVKEWLEKVELIEVEVDELGSRVESQGFIKRFFDGGKATQLNAEVEKLVQQGSNFGEPVLDARETRGETLHTNEIVGVAFNENLERILKVLENRQVSKIGVYGMGGVGKTTLAIHIHNRLVQEYDGRVIWVTVTHEFTIKSLQDKIARFLGVDLSDEDEIAIRAARLRRALGEMDSILIFDDVWHCIDMSEVGCPIEVGCPNSGNCCRLIITTRSWELCEQNSCREIVFVEKLLEDEAWKLFNETLENEIELDPEVQKVAKSMAKLCDGLPLGINTLAASMRGAKPIREWKNAFAELKRCLAGKDDMDGKIFEVLKYSFDRLNMNHQSERNVYNKNQLGFLYCSLYPEDYEIPIEEFARKFISEGQVDQTESRREQVMEGHSILDKLVKVCLLENCIGYDGGDSYKCVKMHDLIRGMALQISRGKYMVRAGDESLIEIKDEEEWTKRLEKVSLMKSGIKRFRDGISPNCPTLSTLMLCGNPLKGIPHSFFSKMKGLCTLDLCETLIKMLPDSLCDMTRLKALLLEDCEKLESLPYLGKLKALRELNLSGTAIKEVPQGLEELFNLTFLSIDAPGLKMIPKGLLRKLEELQHVSVPLHIQVSIEEFQDLKQLDEFCGGVKDVDDFNCFIESRGNSTCYRIGVRSHGSDRYRIGGGSFGCYNNELLLSECNFQDVKVLGQGISYLTIRKCEGLSTCFMDDLLRFDNPRSLNKLRIESCGGTHCILSSEQGLPSEISSLEYIELVELEDLEELIQKRNVGTSAALGVNLFSSLSRLVIYNCNKVRKVGLLVSGVPNLEYIDIRGCGEMQVIFEEEEGSAPATLPNLKGLRLYGLSRLERVSNATIDCKSFSEVSIVKCPRLMNKLPLHLDDPLPPTLKKIEVEKEWWESVTELENPILRRLCHHLLHLL